jgi:hypothetical protein
MTDPIPVPGPDPFMLRLQTNPHVRFTYDETVVRATWTLPAPAVDRFVQLLTDWYRELFVEQFDDVHLPLDVAERFGPGPMPPTSEGPTDGQ